MARSSMWIGSRVLLVFFGAVVALGGLTARAIEDEYGPPSYQIEQLGDFAVTYDVDDVTAFELDELEGDRARVWDTVAGVPEVVFEGTSFEAHAWLHARTRTAVYEGTIDEVEAWVAEQRATGRDMLIPNLVIGAGAVVMAAGLALGWERSEPRQPVGVSH